MPPLSLAACRMLIAALPKPPISLAEGVIIFDHDIQLQTISDDDTIVVGSLWISVYGCKFQLQSIASGIFEGRLTQPLVDITPVGTFVLEYVRIAITPSSDANPPSFDFTGRGRLELQILSQRFVVQGQLQAVHSEATGETYLRLDMEESRMSLPLAGGAILSIMPERLFFIASDSGNIELEMRVGCSVAGLPEFLQNAIAGDALKADVHISRNGLSLDIGNVYDRLALRLPPLPAIGPLPELDLEEIAISVRRLHVAVGNDIQCQFELTIRVPHIFQSFAEPEFSVRFTMNTKDVEIHLLSSPLRAMKLVSKTKGSLHADVDLGECGAISFSVPVLRLDWTNRAFVAEGSFSYRDLRIPLEPIASFLNASQIPSLADKLPQYIVLQSYGLTGIAAVISNLIRQTLNKGPLAEKARFELDRLLQRLDLLPTHLRESFLNIELPTELAFRIEFTTNLGMRVQVTPPRIAANPAPLRLLLPVLGPHGPELIGLSLYRFSVAQIYAGQLFAVEVDAEIDCFELLPIALAATLSNDGVFTRPDDLEQRFVCRNMTALLAFPSGFPAFVPVFFDQLGIRHSGVDGLGAMAMWSFPAPQIDFMAIMRLVMNLGSGTRPDLSALPTCLVLTSGPFWLRLPNYFGGKEIRIEQSTIEIKAPDVIQKFLATIQHVDVDGLLQTISEATRGQNLELELGPAFRKAARLWATVAEPALFVAELSSANTTREDIGMAGRLRLLKERMADGFAALTGDDTSMYLQARLERVTSTGIELVLTQPIRHGEQLAEQHIELHWENFLGSASAMAARMIPH